MKTYTIAVSLVKYKDKYLIGKRSPNKRFDPNVWEFLSGFVEEKESAEETILKELKDEVNLSGKIIKSAEPWTIKVEDERWVMIPFSIEVNSDKFEINAEDHSELKWVSNKELDSYGAIKEETNNFRKAGLLK